MVQTFLTVLVILVSSSCSTIAVPPDACVPQPIDIVRTETKVVVPKIELPDLIADRPGAYDGPEAPQTVEELAQAMLSWESLAIDWKDYAVALEEWYKKVKNILDSLGEAEGVTKVSPIQSPIQADSEKI